MNIPDKFVQYLVEFHAKRDYFECHELLEEFWKESGDDEFSELWVGFIQVAVGQYHDRRGNKRGARLMYESAVHKLLKYIPEQFGVSITSIIQQINNRLKDMDLAYTDFQFEFNDIELERHCKQLAESQGLQWGISSSNVSDYIVHRHIRRNRTDVIQARKDALDRKMQ